MHQYTNMHLLENLSVYGGTHTDTLSNTLATALATALLHLLENPAICRHAQPRGTRDLERDRLAGAELFADGKNQRAPHWHPGDVHWCVCVGGGGT